MNEKLKQRLVGAVVLVSLAVIFLPMLLDGGGERSSMPVFGSNIPDKPDYQFEPLDIPLQPVKTVDEKQPVLIDKAEPAPKPATTAPDKPKTTDTQVSPKPEGRQQSLTDPAPVAAPKATSEQAAWVVQVGSFSQSSNALTLRDKLRKKGFTAFVEKLKTEGKIIYRVRIGPELQRASAEKHLKRLQRIMGMKGIVMEHD